MKIILFILILGFISCDTTDKKGTISVEPKNELTTKATKQDFINFTNDAIEGRMSDTAMILNYFARPESIIKDSIVFTELSHSFKEIKWLITEFPDDTLLLFWGDEITETTYAMYHSDYSKDKFCDNCALVMLKNHSEQRVILCYKDEGIFSSRAYFDWEKWEMNWY